MKQKRHNAILTLISSEVIETQSDLTDALRAQGFNVTQATVSRDIKDLNIMKCQTDDGRYRYAQSAAANMPQGGNRIRTIFSNSVVSVDSALNQVVIKTLSGMAQSAAITIEGMNLPGVLGTIGGDDTVFVICKTEKDATELCAKVGSIYK